MSLNQLNAWTTPLLSGIPAHDQVLQRADIGVGGINANDVTQTRR